MAFAGYRTARTLARAARGRADITLLNPTDYFLYLPLLPQVAAGILEPRRVTVSLSGTLREVRPVLGEAEHVDLDARTVHYTNPEGDRGTLGYDRLVLAMRQRQQAAAHPRGRRARARVPRPARGPLPARSPHPAGGVGGFRHERR